MFRNPLIKDAFIPDTCPHTKILDLMLHYFLKLISQCQKINQI